MPPRVVPTAECISKLLKKALNSFKLWRCSSGTMLSLLLIKAIALLLVITFMYSWYKPTHVEIMIARTGGASANADKNALIKQNMNESITFDLTFTNSLVKKNSKKDRKSVV